MDTAHPHYQPRGDADGNGAGIEKLLEFSRQAMIMIFIIALILIAAVFFIVEIGLIAAIGIIIGASLVLLIVIYTFPLGLILAFIALAIFAMK